MFSNTFAGIAPASVTGFIIAQFVGGAGAILTIRALYPDISPAEAAEAVMPHHQQQPSADGSLSQPLPS
jgi:arsenate reductase